MIKSFDTNILVYATIESSEHHKASNSLLNLALSAPDEWMLSDQILWEYYRTIRNPKVLVKPFTHSEAISKIKFIREESGFSWCCYQMQVYGSIVSINSNAQNSNTQGLGKRIYDLVLAKTLLHNGVTCFFTYNKKDFKDFGFAKIGAP